MTTQFPMTLQSSYLHNPSCRHMAFTRADGSTLAFIPGQFIQIHFDHEGRALRRSYSIATQDPASCEIELAISYVEGGPATGLLSTLQHGEQVMASGPYGRFVLHAADQNARYLLVATGTGVTPYRAMLPQIAERIAERGQEFVLLFGARTEAELLYAKDFEAFAAIHPQFRFYPCFSRSARAPAGPHDRSGYVQQALGELNLDATRDIAYLCGNPNMVDQAFEVLKLAGLPIPNIRREKYISPK
jgi:ferredoxin-NADP reductase